MLKISSILIFFIEKSAFEGSADFCDLMNHFWNAKGDSFSGKQIYFASFQLLISLLRP
jgi:hypothetical protein